MLYLLNVFFYNMTFRQVLLTFNCTQKDMHSMAISPDKYRYSVSYTNKVILGIKYCSSSPRRIATLMWLEGCVWGWGVMEVTLRIPMDTRTRLARA